MWRLVSPEVWGAKGHSTSSLGGEGGGGRGQKRLFLSLRQTKASRKCQEGAVPWGLWDPMWKHHKDGWICLSRVRSGGEDSPSCWDWPSGGSRACPEGKAGQAGGMQEHGGGWWEGRQRVRRGGEPSAQGDQTGNVALPLQGEGDC